MITRAKEILAAAKGKMSNAVTHLDEELKTYRAGKANPMVFNNVMVDYYGSPTPGGFCHYSGRQDTDASALGEEDDSGDREGNPRCEHRSYSFKQR